MIIVDSALRRRLQESGPIQVALVGAGYMGRGTALQIVTAFPGIRLAAIVARKLPQAERAYREAGISEFEYVTSPAAMQRALEGGRFAVADDPAVVCSAGGIEVVIETTGDAEYGARVAAGAIDGGKHIVLMNAEVDSTVGPILKVRADRQGVIYTYTDGDEPGVAMNLFRFVDSIGYQPVMLGQIKGFLDRYRNPDTQREFAERHGQKAQMVASFADGSKLAIEATIMGNATGFVPAKRGMHGHRCAHVKDLLQHFTETDFRGGGLVDYVLGAEPHTGAFVIGYNDNPVKRGYMEYFKFGPGPLYMFYTPYHLAHLQLPHSVARAALFSDATLAPRGAPACDAVSLAKRDLRAGETLDGMGGFACYGMVDSWAASRSADALPIALSGGCRLLRDVPRDSVIRYADVELPPGRLCDRLRAEQTEYFPS